MFFMVLTSDKEQAFFVVQKTMSLFVRHGFLLYWERGLLIGQEEIYKTAVADYCCTFLHLLLPIFRQETRQR